MISDQKHLDFFRQIVNGLYEPMIVNDYGSDKIELLLCLTNSISDIYKYVKYYTFRTIVVYISLDKSDTSTISPESNRILSYENLVPLGGENIIIEVKPNGDLFYVLDTKFDFDTYRENAIIYSYTQSDFAEIIFGKTSEITLPRMPYSDSYFAVRTYKELDLALENYKTKVARYSDCGFLKDVWADSNKIFFKPKPEHILRDSLSTFLKHHLRNSEVRPEQIVDTSHPVDIKVTWQLTSHLALIEIKWLGKSIDLEVKDKFSTVYAKQRAIDGANQLVGYLESNRIQSPLKSTKGYLAVFDARRGGCTTPTTTLKRSDGLKYENDIIEFEPDHAKLRNDFAKPIFFFMEPLNMIYG